MRIESRSRITTWKDYLALAKPRVVLLHLVTAAAAMFLASQGAPPARILVLTLLGGGLVAGAANVINCCYDRDIDRMMIRTRNRPLPAERLNSYQALTFSIIIGLAGLLILSQLVNIVTAVLALGALVYYVLIYTIWLKRRTYWSSLIGSGAGAFPPLIGWLAITSELEITPFLLFFMIVLWTPPHFWSLAIYYRQDYGQAGVNVVPIKNSNLPIFLSSLGLIMVSLLLIPLAGLGIVYLISALVLGLVLLFLSTKLLLKETPDRAKSLFHYSIIYLIVLFGFMLIDRIIV